MQYDRVIGTAEEILQIRQDAGRENRAITHYKDPDRAVFGFLIGESVPDTPENAKEPFMVEIPRGRGFDRTPLEAPSPPDLSGRELVVWMKYGRELDPDVSYFDELVQLQSLMEDVPDALVWGSPLEYYLVSYADAESGRSIVVKPSASVTEPELQRISQWIVSGGAGERACPRWYENLGIPLPPDGRDPALTP